MDGSLALALFTPSLLVLIEQWGRIKDISSLVQPPCVISNLHMNEVPAVMPPFLDSVCCFPNAADHMEGEKVIIERQTNGNASIL